MCRLILVNKKDFDKYDSRYGILPLMKHLESECGGHGNGYTLIKDNIIINMDKGVKLRNEDIYSNIIKEDWDYLLWHTRIKSSGANKDDTSCHPFVKGEDCIVMNGTEYDFETMALALGIIDTQVIFKCIEGLSLSRTMETLSHLSSVFIGTVDGVPYAVNAGGSLYKWNDSSLHASSFPLEVKKTKRTDAGYMWRNGKVISSKVKKDTYKPYSYSYASTTKPYALWDMEQEEHEEYEIGYEEGYEEGYNAAIEEYALRDD